MHKLIFIITMISVMGFVAKGQEVSKIVSYPELSGAGSLICSYGSGSGSLIYSYTPLGSVHKILAVGDAFSYQYDLPQIITSEGTLGYQVRDMHVEGNTLYLGGTMYTPMLEEPPATARFSMPSDTVGFIAKIGIDSVSLLSSPNIRSCFCAIDGTRCINRFAVKYEGADTLVGMIAAPAVGSRPRLALMKGMGPMWECYLYDVGDETEIMTDIAFMPKHLVLASRFEADSSRFCIRYSSSDDLYYSQDPTQLGTQYVFSVGERADECIGVHDACHYGDAEIKVVAMGYGNYVTVAYESKHYYAYGYPDNFSKYVVLLHVNVPGGSSPSITAAKRFIIHPDFNNEFVGFRRNRSSQELALLCRMENPTRFSSQIIRFTWGSSTASRNDAQTESLASIDLNGNSLVACGAQIENSHLIRYYQNTGYQPWQCIEELSASACNASNLPTVQITSAPFPDPIPIYISWTTAERVAAEYLFGTRICTTNAEDY